MLRCARSVVAQLPEVDAESAQLAVQVRALHADTLRELPDLAVAQQELLLQVGPLELFPGLAQRQSQQVLLDQRLVDGALLGELALDFFEPDFLAAAENEDALDEIPELPDIARLGIIAQAVLRGDAESPQRQALVVDQAIDVIAQQIRNVLGVFTQRRHLQRDHVQVGE